VDSVVTHPDGSVSHGIFQFGLREFERQIPSGKDLLNLADLRLLEQPSPLQFTPVLNFSGDDFNPIYTLDPVSLDLDLGVVQPGDTASWVYTLTAQGTTHGFERGYFSFLGDPFSGQVGAGNLTERFVSSVPEPSTSSNLLLGLVGLLLWQFKARQCRCWRAPV
jgi:hypothetical protein